jgi:hypothetical protein
MRRPARVIALIACAAMLVFGVSSLSVSTAHEKKKGAVPTGPTGVKAKKKCKHKHRHTHGRGVGQRKHNHKHKCFGKHHRQAH